MCIVFSTGKNRPTETKNAFFGKCFISEESKRREFTMKNNNQINVPQAREAMDKFKMQAAQDEDVSFTS